MSRCDRDLRQDSWRLDVTCRPFFLWTKKEVAWFSTHPENNKGSFVIWGTPKSSNRSYFRILYVIFNGQTNGGVPEFWHQQKVGFGKLTLAISPSVHPTLGKWLKQRPDFGPWYHPGVPPSASGVGAATQRLLPIQWWLFQTSHCGTAGDTTRTGTKWGQGFSSPPT